MPSNVTRRQFLQTSAATAAGALIGRTALGADKPAKKVRYAMVAVGGRGGAHLGWAG
ncbi:MAG: twin-arginine translocation signal domain-containing protein [Phycisphaerae bacterium]|nr:twin-arginine translocation signal domain-containing protein [Phycisphaerae bacterium]